MDWDLKLIHFFNLRNGEWLKILLVSENIYLQLSHWTCLSSFPLQGSDFASVLAVVHSVISPVRIFWSSAQDQLGILDSVLISIESRLPDHTACFPISFSPWPAWHNTNIVRIDPRLRLQTPHCDPSLPVQVRPNPRISDPPAIYEQLHVPKLFLYQFHVPAFQRTDSIQPYLQIISTIGDTNLFVEFWHILVHYLTYPNLF